MTWTLELNELQRRTAMAQRMGGADKVKRQHEGGRLTVRERIEGLVDGGSFHDMGALSGIADRHQRVQRGDPRHRPVRGRWGCGHQPMAGVKAVIRPTAR